MLVAAWLFVPAAAPAQTSQWILPVRGSAEFERRSDQLVIAPPEYDSRRGIRHVVRASNAGGHSWRHRQFKSGLGNDGWQEVEYTETGNWRDGHTPFGDTWQRTRWPADQRYLDLRTTFELGRRTPKAAVLNVSHDDQCVVYLNGLEIYRGEKYLTDQWIGLDEVATEAFVAGRNMLAVRVINTGGASHFDLGLTTCDRSFRDHAQAVNLVRDDAQAAGRLRNGLLPGFRSPPYLCQGQLGEEQQRIDHPPIDIRDFGPYLALDLTRNEGGGTVAGELPTMFRFGHLEYKGRAERVAAETGVQRIEAQLETRVPEGRGKDARFVEARIAPYYSHMLQGTVTIDRRLDPARGVTWFRYDIDATLKLRSGDDADKEFGFHYGEEWKLVDVHENRDKPFRDDVIEAIRKGAEKLKGEIANPNKNVLKNQPNGNRTYNTGRLALSLLALLHAEVPHDDPAIVKGMAELRRRRLYDTYSTAHAIMAMEKYYTPRGELEELRAGKIDRPRTRQPSEEDRKLIEEWTATLMNNIDTRVDKGYLWRWNYERGGRYDHSVNQYGLLGMYSAHLCGIDVSATLWEGAANHLIDSQQRPVDRIKLTLTNHKQWEEEKRGGTSSAGPRATKVAGWGYYGPESNGLQNQIYGSMTCAGLTGLTICLAGLRDKGVDRGRLASEAEEALRMGFAWLAHNFTVHSNACRYDAPYHWCYYYLYGLERSCELSGVALLQGRDWYYEGALTLLELQHDDGGWPDDLHPDEVMERTAMAVLFLKKSAMPVYTSK